MKSLKANIVTGLAAGLAAFPALAGAQVDSFGAIVNVIQRAISWIFALFILLAVVFVLYAAFKYLTSRGDSGKVGEASQALIYAAVAIGVALIAASIQFIVAELLGLNSVELVIPDPFFIQ
ncbi:MAG: hypothetical protein HYT12_01475 [Candidatus Liptonbacteria bacterium]|nr:hypothetical protein [Candidatus Liptonbacteria bacterium]